MPRPLRSALRNLYFGFDRLHHWDWAGGNPRRRTAPGAGFEAFPYEFEDGSPILCDHLYPGHFPQHGEIDAAETDACQEDVDAITQGLVVQRFDRLRQRLRAVRLSPAFIHFGIRFFDRSE